MRQPLAWDVGPVESTGEKADRETRITDFVLFACLPLYALDVPGLGLPLNEVAALAIVGLAVFRRPREGPSVPIWFGLGLLAIIALLTLSALLNDVDGLRRLVHMVGYVGLALTVASGRVSLLSAARGLAISLAACVVHGAATVGSSAYVGRLTGLFADPNVAALVLMTLGAVSVPHVRLTWLRRILLLTIAGGVILTFSRTGLLAMGLGVLWVVAGRRLRTAGGAALVAAVLWGVGNLPEDLRQVGPFSDRSGSDALRDRIIAAEDELLATLPWYGNGPGTAQVLLDEQVFFFHNSYLATQNEGGWLLVGLVVGLLAACFALLSTVPGELAWGAAWTQTGIIGLLAMASTLGEVLLDLPTAIVLGFAISTVLAARRASGAAPPERGPTP